MSNFKHKRKLGKHKSLFSCFLLKKTINQIFNHSKFDFDKVWKDSLGQLSYNITSQSILVETALEEKMEWTM